MLAVSISLDWLCCLLCVSSSLFVRSQGSSVNRMLCIEQNGIVSCLQLPVISSPSGPTHLISADGRCHTNYCLGLPNSANSFKLDHTASQCRTIAVCHPLHTWCNYQFHHRYPPTFLYPSLLTCWKKHWSHFFP